MKEKFLKILSLPSRARSEKGASLVEYGLLVGLIVVGMIGSVRSIGKKLDSSYDNSAQCMSDNPDDIQYCKDYLTAGGKGALGQ